MGYYIQGPRVGKADYIIATFNGRECNQEVAALAMKDPRLGVIVVLENGMFDAAGFAFSEEEFKEFCDPFDTRPKRFVVIPREIAEKESGYSPPPPPLFPEG